MILFNAAELRPVLIEVRSHACPVVLVKDQGVYMLPEKSNANGEPRPIAYAVGCNPDTVPFDEWWDRAVRSLVVTTSSNISIRMTLSLTASSTMDGIWKSGLTPATST